MTGRRGATVLEVLVALPLTMLVIGLATGLLVTQLRVTMSGSARVEATRTVSHASLVLAHDVRALAAADLVTWTDSSVQADVPVLVGVTCGAPSTDRLDLVATAGPLGPLWRDAPAAGDGVSWAMADTSIAGDAVTDSARHAVSLQSASSAPSACADSPLRGPASPIRLTLATSVPNAVLPPPGVLVVVRRRVEWRAYRAADADTWLGRRERTAGGWTVIQPAVGPLASVADGGLVLSVRRADGSPALPGAPDARVVHLRLRAPRRGTPAGAGAQVDTLALRITLRGGH